MKSSSRLILFAGILCLLMGLWAGLEKLEWIGSDDFSSFPSQHGPFMVSGFLGTVISLERAAALGAGWAYAAPVFAAAGALLLARGFSPAFCVALISIASAVFSAASAVLFRRQASAPNTFLVAAALLWLAGNLVWLAGGWSAAVLALWIGFLLFTIVAERLEIARFAASGSKAAIGFIYAALLLYAAAAGFWNSSPGAVRLGGVCLAGIACWLARYDVARRNFAQPGLPGFSARNLIFGYAWLLVSGLWMAGFPSVQSGFHYDAALHAFFLGFVLSMIFAHAPIIFPSVAGIDLPFSNRFYLHFALLHFSLALRIGADAAGSAAGRKWGGLLNAAALILFLLNSVSSALAARIKRDSSR